MNSALAFNTLLRPHPPCEIVCIYLRSVRKTLLQVLGKETVQHRNLYVGPNIGIRVRRNRVEFIRETKGLGGCGWETEQ